MLELNVTLWYVCVYHLLMLTYNVVMLVGDLTAFAHAGKQCAVGEYHARFRRYTQAYMESWDWGHDIFDATFSLYMLLGCR